MAVLEVTIRSLGELIDRITPTEPDSQTGRLRDNGVYRGALDADAALLTSLDRLGGITPPHTKADVEEHLLRNFIRYSRPYLPGTSSSDWELLIAAQHHGVPTRLLDWSYSPLVAAFFATRGYRGAYELPDEAQEQCRAVWRLDWQRVHDAFGLPCLALQIEELRALFGTSEELTPWQLFDNQHVERPVACLIEPPSLDERIVAQSGTFTLCSTKEESFDQFLTRHDLDFALTKFIIPADCVAKLRDQLDLASIDERRLFPDLDGVAAALRRYYM